MESYNLPITNGYKWADVFQERATFSAAEEANSKHSEEGAERNFQAKGLENVPHSESCAV